MESLNKLPKPFLVVAVLIIAALFIILSDPPKNICDSQLDVFLSSQSGRISSLKGRIGGLWARTAKYCQESKTLGGCSEFYNTVKVALRDIDNTSLECVNYVISQESVQKIIKDSTLLMVKMAWGEVPPEPGPQVYGWHRMSELALYCGLKKNIMKLFSDEEWELFVRSTISKLPQASQLSFDEAFGRSLFSVRCESVL